MQIDFHHTVTYVIARLADFSKEEADIIAHCAQYVDDATDSGLVHFYTNSIEDSKPELGPTYSRISSAHKMLDYRNSKELANRRVWVPFHFLPSNDQSPKKKKDLTSKSRQHNPFFPRLICRPNSPVAQEMVRRCIEEKINISPASETTASIHKRQYIKALCRLGITMHVYADTWAHQDFAGIMHEMNAFTDIRSGNPENDKRVKQYQGLNDEHLNSLQLAWKKFSSAVIDPIAAKFLGESFPLGHGSALSYPDLPFLEWGYKKIEKYMPFSEEYLDRDNDGFIVRNNTEIFLDAADHMYKAMLAFKNDNKEVDLVNSGKIPQAQRQKIQTLFKEFTDEDSLKRHQQWVEKINSDYFTDEKNSDGSAGTLGYQSHHHELDEWRNEVLMHKKTYRSGIFLKDTINYFKKQMAGIVPESMNIEYQVTYKFPEDDRFLDSNWKLFHDALLAHRYTVLHEILPHEGICAG